MKHLKKVRIVVSLLFFLLTFLLFIDFRHILPEKFINYLLYLQFAPSMMKFITVVGIAALGFLIVIVLTLLFGRVYCSSICPLGTLQDGISHISKRVQKRNKKKKKIYKYNRPHNWWRYGFLAVVVIFLLAGSVFALNLLDPFSNFGRISVNLIKPIYIGINNIIANTLLKFDLFWLYPAKYGKIDWIFLLYPSAILGVVTWMSYRKGRLYCNAICPVGTLLGLISRFSLFKIRISDSECNNCGLCEWDCKSNCIDKVNKHVDFSRCVNCFNCFTVCKKDAMTYKMSWQKKPVSKKTVPVHVATADESKRSFIAGSAVILMSIFGFKLNKMPSGNYDNASLANPGEITSSRPTIIPESKDFPVTPPGASTIRKFTDRCTACHLCVSACPTHVIQPSLTQYGLTGFMQPHMDYHAGFCNFECTICMDVCPAGALLPVSLEEKKLIQLGKAVFIKENCVVETDGTDCGACSEHCPTKAVDMIPYHDGLFIPQVTEDICIGCGACEYACPTKPYKAIFVNGNAVHVNAQKPQQEALDIDIDYTEDFPF